MSCHPDSPSPTPIDHDSATNCSMPSTTADLLGCVWSEDPPRPSSGSTGHSSDHHLEGDSHSSTVTCHNSTAHLPCSHHSSGDCWHPPGAGSSSCHSRCDSASHHSPSAHCLCAGPGPQWYPDPGAHHHDRGRTRRSCNHHAAHHTAQRHHRPGQHDTRLWHWSIRADSPGHLGQWGHILPARNNCRLSSSCTRGSLRRVPARSRRL
jgi:hypothetical protein